MTDARSSPRLAQKALHDVGVSRTIAANHFERERLLEHDVRGPVHDPHATLADALLDAITTVHHSADQWI